MVDFQDTLDLLLLHGTGLFLIFLRVGFSVLLLPILGEQFVPTRVRLGAAFVFSGLVYLVIDLDMTVYELTFYFIIRSIATESISGLCLGMWFRFFIIAMQTAGTIAAQSTSLSQLMGNQGVEPLPAIGHLLSISCLALLLTSGFLSKLLLSFVSSYHFFEIFEFPSIGLISLASLRTVSKIFSLSFSLAAPFLVLSLLYNLTLGVINKAMPQLMVAFVGAPAITLGSIILLFLTAPIILQVWLVEVDHFFTLILGV